MEHDYEQTEKSKILDAYKNDMSEREETIKKQENEYFPKETESSKERHDVLDEYRKLEEELNEMEYTSKRKLTELAGALAKRKYGNNAVKDEDVANLVERALKQSNGSFSSAAGNIKHYFTR
jgi:hypothetical protein